MAGQQLTLPGEIVKKDNLLIRSKIDIESVQSSKILACLIASINKDDTVFKNSYRIEAKDVLSHYGGENYTRIKNLCLELRKAGVSFEFKDESGEPVFLTVSFFSRVEYKKGIIEATFTQDPLISDCLLGLKNKFTEYNLIDYLKLPSIYSQRMFEILKSWSNLPEVIIRIDKLHHMLNTPVSFKADFRQFRTRVLEKAYKDIQEKTALRYEWEPIKAGRSVEAIRFTFGPGRRALAEAEKAKAKEDKARRLLQQRMFRAIDCAKAKNGDCRARDNKPIVCKVCRQENICASLQSRTYREISKSLERD